MRSHEYMAACGLPEWMGDLWTCEAAVDNNGELIFHIDQLAESLQMNDRHLAHSWHAGFVPFALCRTREQADAACDRLRRKHRALRQLQQEEAIR